MDIVCIGDTHGRHNDLEIPEANTIIHTGDITDLGTRQETVAFLKWFSSLPHQNKIFIAGNHDFYLQNLSPIELNALIPKNVHYLNNSELIVEGIHFWGSPITPGNKSWAFHAERGKSISKYWDMIPPRVNVLITHTPPFGILDHVKGNYSIGCEKLLQKIEKEKPRLHIFGHVHEGYGIWQTISTTFINSSSFSQNPPIPNTPILVKTDAFS